MTTALRRAFVLGFVAVAPLAACGKAEKKPAAAVTAAPAAPAAPLEPIRQELVSAKAEVTLPGEWKYGYRVMEKPDTAFGGYRAFEFHYTADTARKVPPRLLLVIRAFRKPAWEKIRASQKGLQGELATHGDDVYTFSIVTSNPYPTGTASALRVDQMMLALIAETSPFRLTFK